MRRFLSAILCLISAQTVGADFTIVVLPDTQLYSQDFPEIFTVQTEWIRDNRDALNIVFVLHEGDIVNRGNNPNWAYSWENADTSLSILDGVVPYSLAVGNHDMGPNGDAENRDTTLYNQYFPYTRYESEPWYGGHMGSDNDNHYCLFRADGMDFMVITLEFGPNSEMVAWANDVVLAHPDRRVIVLTHCYTFHDDTRVGPGDSWNPHTYGINNVDDPHDGEELWETFVRHHPNIFLVTCGHILGDGLGRLTSSGDNGNPVHQVLANYQMLSDGGDGWLRQMTFIPSEDRIAVQTYSPWLFQSAEDEQNLFDLEYEMTIGGDWDDDGDVDLLDYERFLDCFSGPGVEIGSECGVFDLDGDNDVDLTDFGSLQEAFTGAD